MKHIKLFEAFLNEAHPVKEINTEFLEALKNKDELWGKSGDKGLLYNGQNVFDVYISDESFDKYHEAIMKDDEIAKEEDFDAGSYQECYLGYMPSHDCFLVGFDVFTDKTKAIMVEFNIENGEVQNAKVHDASPNLFYSNGIHSMYKGISTWREREGEERTIIDIRLD